MALQERYRAEVAPETGESFQPRYDLSKDEAHKLCVEFLSEQEERPEGQFGCYIVDGDTEFSNLGRAVESEVFLESFGNTPGIMHQEYGPYEKASTFFVVVDQEHETPVGVMRVIKNSEAGLKSLVDLEKTPIHLPRSEVFSKYNINPDRCIDIATLAVNPEFRARVGNILPSLLLYRTLYSKYLASPKYDHVVNIIDKKAEKNLKRLSFPFQPIDERYFTYLDSQESRALYGINAEFYSSVESRRNELVNEAEREDDSKKAWLAAMLDGLANGTHLDEMLAFDSSQPV